MSTASQIHQGNLIIRVDDAADYSALTQVTGGLYVNDGAMLTAPVLTTAGSLDIYAGATLTAPVLTQVTGSLYVYEGGTLTAPVLMQVTGYIYVREGATLTAPALQRPEGAPDAKELRLAVADQLERHPELHDQGSWGDGRADPACSTPCCVAGWTCHLGGGTYGLTVEYAAQYLLFLSGHPMPSFTTNMDAESIIADLRK
jgi:hypothetical protein